MQKNTAEERGVGQNKKKSMTKRESAANKESRRERRLLLYALSLQNDHVSPQLPGRSSR